MSIEKLKIVAHGKQNRLAQKRKVIRVVIAVIPARGGSKGILRKNLRLLGGVPLLSYSIRAANECDLIDKVLVTTDDEEISQLASSMGVLVRMRPSELGADNISLDPVVVDAVEWFEKLSDSKVDIVVTIQPTSPLLTSILLKEAIIRFSDRNCDSLISVVDNTHLGWVEVSNEILPDYGKRVNRQWLPKKFKETGSFVICKRHLLNEGKRIGGKITIFEVPEEVAVDIDSPTDWLICSALLNRMKIRFIVTANNETGMGHLYRALTLADYWLGNDVSFVLYCSDEKASNLISSKGYRFVETSSLNAIINELTIGQLIVNDLLDTDIEYISELKKKGTFVVNFEDLGSGSMKADLVVNALYERFNPPPNHFYGFQFECLRTDFLMRKPNVFSDELNTIIVTFGGADPANLTRTTLEVLEKLDDSIRIKVIIGPTYRFKPELREYIGEMWQGRNIEIHESVSNMAKLMERVDLAITSNGRTIYELASMKIPIISVAQNDRETMHLFARYSGGIKYIGIACNTTKENLSQALEKIINDDKLRNTMYNALPTKEIRRGIFNVTELIENEFRRWKNERNLNW